MRFLDEQLVLLHDEQWSLHSTAIRQETNLLRSDVSHDGDLFRDGALPSLALDMADELGSITMATDPVSIDENLNHIFVLEHQRVQGVQIFHAEVIQDVGKSL